jgi:chemotaxis protein MotC
MGQRASHLIISSAAVILIAAGIGFARASEHAEEPAPAEAEPEKPAEEGKAAQEHKDSKDAEAGKEGTEGKDGGEAEPSMPLWQETPVVENERQPFVLMRTLRSVQDKVATGSGSAHEMQKRLLRDYGEQMRSLPIEVWDDVRNVRAAVFFVLSGGDPRVVKTVIGRDKVRHLERRLLKGALAYGEGRLVDALGMLLKIDALELDPSLGGIVALIQGTLIAKKEPAKAVSFFDKARLLAPGTLIEEAALRQEILLVARDGNLQRFDTLSSQYSRRFSRSLFAPNFRRQFFAGVARQYFKGDKEWISRTENELQKVPLSERAEMYLAIAEEATKNGHVDMGQYAAGKAHDLARPGSREEARSLLYQGAALVATQDFDKGVALLNSADQAKLTTSDKQVLQAALALAQAVGRWPEVTGEVADAVVPGVTRAQELLSNVDELLKGNSQ